MNKLIGLVIIVFAAVILINMFAFIVDQTQYALVLRFGEFERSIMEPGLYFRIPGIHTVKIFDNRVLDYDSPPTEVVTADKKTVVIDNFAKWRITEPLQFYKSVNNELNMTARLDEIVYGKLREEIGKKDFSDFIKERDVIMEEVLQLCKVWSKGEMNKGKIDPDNENSDGFGVEILDVRIKRLDLAKENESSVFQRMKTERERMAKEYRAQGEKEAKTIRSEADKEVKIKLSEAKMESEKIIGEAERKAIKIYADAYERGKDFFLLLKKLDLLDKTFNKGTKVIMSTKSEAFDILDSYDN
ncbi:MAG: protease modulator HflC [Candidatus Muiribacterium halophilum]|uniref:Protein HflC n=1 Tax=Muiribacterium halophilum TaxID=2053465 RepID=A0A2N5ZL74_MUIH1|nr:MAG: protease modulator HflC [Candidatus Muirbacterium halophilum]